MRAPDCVAVARGSTPRLARESDGWATSRGVNSPEANGRWPPSTNGANDSEHRGRLLERREASRPLPPPRTLDGMPSGERGVRVEIGEHRGVVRVARRAFGACFRRRPPPRGASAYYRQRIRFESIARRKLRRQLTEDGNVPIPRRLRRTGALGKVARSLRINLTSLAGD